MIARLAHTAGIARTAPFAIGSVVLLWGFGLASGAVTHGPTALLLAKANLGLPVFDLNGTWYPLASRLWCADLLGYLATTIVLVAVCGAAERVIGSLRTAGIFGLCLLGTTVLSAAGLALSGSFDRGWNAGLRSASASGPSAGAFGVLLATTCLSSPLWRRRIRAVSLVTLATFALYSGQLQDISRLGAALIGLVVGPLLLGNRDGFATVVPDEPKESRTLVALVVAAAALGPLIASIDRVFGGPATWLRELWLAPAPTDVAIARTCQDRLHNAGCHLVRSYVSGHGLGSEIRMLLPVLISLVLAEGLRRGRRGAYRATLAFYVALASFGALVIVERVVLVTGRPAAGSIGKWVAISAAVIVPLGVAVLIYRLRAQFGIRAPRGTYKRLGAVALGAFTVSSAAYVIGAYASRAQFDRIFGIRDLLRNLPLRFLPPSYLGIVRPVLYPAGGAAREVSDWTGAAFWIVVLVGMLVAFRATPVQQPTVMTDAMKALLRLHGGSNLSYMSTWNGNSHWISADGRAAIGYRVVASVAISVGDPLGDRTARPAAVREFAEFASRSGWEPCLFCISEDLAQTLASDDWLSLCVAEEAVVSLGDLSLSGHSWQDVRTAMNRARRTQIAAEWVHLAGAPPAIRQQVADIAESWRAAHRGPELAFTLGGVAELEDRDTRCLLAIDPAGTVHGVVSWLPVHQDGTVVGWTLDFMRRSPVGFKGVTDFLIGSSALAFGAEGAQFMSLSGIPLARASYSGANRVLVKILDQVGELLNRAFGFGTLLAFKDKFRPTYHPLMLAYRDPAALPRIGYAIGRAYVPRISWREAVAFGGSVLLRRQAGDVVGHRPVRRFIRSWLHAAGVAEDERNAPVLSSAHAEPS